MATGREGCQPWARQNMREPFYDYDKEKTKVRRKDG
jgi:hypothetical protein